MGLEKDYSDTAESNDKSTKSTDIISENTYQMESQKVNASQEEDTILDLSAVAAKAKTLFTKWSENKESVPSHPSPKKFNVSDFTRTAKKTIQNIITTSKTDSATQEETRNSTTESLNFTSVFTFMKKNQKWLIPILFMIIAITASTYIRMMPSSLPITEQWAENQVNFFYRQQLEAQINQQYPHLPLQNRESLVQKEIEKFMLQNKKSIAADIAQLSTEFKNQFSDANGDTYLLGIDPYLWYSEARNVVHHGHLGDKKINDESYFTLRDGRLDKRSSFQLHPYVGAYFFKVLSFINPNISLMRTMFLLPVFLIAIAIIPAFCIGRKLAGNAGGLFAALFFALNAPLVSRTVAGFSDTDSYSVFFPLFISWFFLEAYTAETKKRLWLFSILAGFTVGIYAAAWTGWSAVFLFVLGAIILSLLLKVLQQMIHTKNSRSLITNESIQKHIHLIAAYLISSGIFVSLFDSFRTFHRGFGRPLRFIALKEVGLTKIWPNVLTTVAEFNTNQLSTIIDQMGGILVFWLALMGIIFLVITSSKRNAFNLWYGAGSGLYYLIILYGKEYLNNPLTFVITFSLPIIIGLVTMIYFNEEINVMYPLLLIIWLTATAYAYTKGMRFALLMAPGFALALGSSLGFLWKKSSRWLHDGIHLDLKLSKVLVLAVLGLLIISPFSDAQTVAKNEFPLMNDAWYTTLTKIKMDSERAIITSWWDFGHWFVAVAERMVTFDGGDQGERIYWVGKALLSDTEAEAVGILRMLNCAQETAVDTLDQFTGDNLKSIRILNTVLPLADSSMAYQEYKKLGLTEEQASTMQQYTHCQDIIPNYFITSEDMVKKAGVWGHFGSWNFEKATMYQNTVKLSRMEAVNYLMTNFDMTEEEAEETHHQIQTTKADDWIAPWPRYISEPRLCEKGAGNTFRCKGSVDGGELTIIVTMDIHDAYSEADTTLKPDSLVYATPSGVVEKELSDTKMGFSLVLIPKGDNYLALFTDPLQAAGLFTRLFFFEGHGLHCFHKFDDLQQVTGERIITWKVDYECQQENKVYFKPKEVNGSIVINQSLNV
ncbi:MAG: STT3 domain-containing protein [Nanoarchaeota archaeon]|nr:STT3 domain-containing protein [Nanoarchaeota archaeon]